MGLNSAWLAALTLPALSKRIMRSRASSSSDVGLIVLGGGTPSVYRRRTLRTLTRGAQHIRRVTRIELGNHRPPFRTTQAAQTRYYEGEDAARLGAACAT
jgi:hypothetical protein